MNEEIIRLLVELHWERVYISLDAATNETYKKIRGRDLEHVEYNINKLLDMRGKNKSMLPLVRVSFVIQEENRQEIDQFIDKWKDKVDIIDFQNLVHYETMDIKSNIPRIDYQCAYPFRTMLLDCDGNLYPCCTEFGYKMPIGNVNNISIKEAWNSKFMNIMRENMRDKRLNNVCNMCANCIEFH